MADQPGRDAMEQGFEASDVPAGRTSLWAIALLGVVALIAVIIGGLLILLIATTPRPPASIVEEAPVRPPPPRLQAEPEADLATVRAREQQRLQGLGWIDQSAGIAHIPIDRAMDLLAQRGWPPQPPAQGGGK